MRTFIFFLFLQEKEKEKKSLEFKNINTFNFIFVIIQSLDLETKKIIIKIIRNLIERGRIDACRRNNSGSELVLAIDINSIYNRVRFASLG